MPLIVDPPLPTPTRGAWADVEGRQTMRELYIGLMSGTSLDGVDAVLVSMDKASVPQVLGAVQLAYPAALKEAVLTA